MEQSKSQGTNFCRFRLLSNDQSSILNGTVCIKSLLTTKKNPLLKLGLGKVMAEAVTRKDASSMCGEVTILEKNFIRDYALSLVML
jgi:hypothetical protein